MHIADGLLSPEVCLATGAISAGALGLSLRKLNQTVSTRTIPLTGMMAALIFAGQMVKFPLMVVPAYGHLLGGVLAAVIVGPWAGCLALALVLFLQMVLFADGGWLAYGANLLNMGVVGSLGGYSIYAAVRRRIPGPRGIIVGAVIASWTSVVAGSALFCVEFGLSQPPGTIALPRLFAIMTSFHSLVGVGEALITGGIVSYIVAQRPDLVYSPQSQPGVTAGFGRFVWSGAVAALAVAAFVAPFFSEGADALEATAETLQFDSLEAPPRVVLLSDYLIPLPGLDLESGFWQKLSVSLAGVFGTTCVLAMSFAFGRILGPKGAAAEAGHVG